MKLNQFAILCIALSFSTLQLTHSAAINKTANTKVTLPSDKTSLIEKALTQQKNESSKAQSSDDSLKVLTSIKTAPAQNFFASQNQSFSRFVQALFSTNPS
ncbi:MULTISPECIES: hypothetical protein [Acinetobacter]|jgi:hypothetical protein|uniref:DUF4179 domain-containing protein n=1 Tax=Acinetobacter chengduensis TaxID=2420890 RepID=A0ABX9TWY6_9GAMM|nr:MULTISPECIES: hypothetical protein [Acinetobacter]MBI1451881.1 hypothetical protein [Acinetobacter sp. FL51]RKG44215.1 hypothetical protein D7V31_02770 [Acinetobacter sp. WCHAc060007]RLL21549.1 hypothetical protein D9K81_09960 [Acinetobacter chengduensis]